MASALPLLGLMFLVLCLAWYNREPKEETVFPLHYKELGVGKNATQKEIKSASRRLLAKNHPDKCPRCKDKFIKVNAANTVLKDGLARRKYDAELREYELWGVGGKKEAPPTNIIIVIISSLLGSAWLQYAYLKSKSKQMFTKFMALPKNKKRANDAEFVASVREELGLTSRMVIIKQTFIVSWWTTIPRILNTWFSTETAGDKKKKSGNGVSSKGLSPEGASRATYIRFIWMFLLICLVYQVATYLVVWKCGLRYPFITVERTGMRPEFDKGDLLVIEWGKSVKSALATGDILAFQIWDEDPITVHRIVRLRRDTRIVGNDWLITTKGDRLDKDDEERQQYPEDRPYLTDQEVIGRVVWKLPFVYAATIRIMFSGNLAPWLVMFLIYCYVAVHLASKAKQDATVKRRVANIRRS